MAKKLQLPIWLRKFGIIFAVLGPGLITASADNDAPGIATYSMVGSTYGYSFLWLILVITLGEVVIQEMAARMGAVTGKGTADLIREKYGVRISTFAMLCLLIANFGTTVAQFAGVVAAGELFGISRYITAPLAAIIFSVLILRGSYKSIEKVLLVLCLSALSYVVTVFLIKPDWGVIAQAALVPHIEMDSKYILSMLAVVGTTLAPWGIIYMQASVADKGIDLNDYKLTKLDVSFGAAWGNVISAFILITTAATLFVAGISVESAEQAAMALEPLAGAASTVLFSLGLLGASLLAVSVLPLSTTYAICEAFGFERGLNRSPKEAPIFYSIFAGIMILAVIIVLIPSMPLFEIMWMSQSVNAILLPIILVLVLQLANDKVIMGGWVNKRFSNVVAISLTVLVTIISLVLFVSPLIS